MKNMKKLILKISLTMSIILIYSSCSESFLETVPLNEASDVSFYTKASDAVAAVNAIYDIMQWNGLWKQELQIIGNRMNNDLGLIRPTDYPSQFQATNARRLTMWAMFYVGINRANIALERIPEIEMDEALKARLLGEAKFLRAFYNFSLTIYFGDIVLKTEATTITNLEKAKTPKSDVIAHVRQDLSEAYPVLPLRSAQASSDIGRATKGAAAALLGKVELYQKNYAAAATQFALVINSNEYELNADYSLQFQDGGDNTLESIFEIQHLTNTGGWDRSSEGSWFSAWNSSKQDGINYGFGNGYQPNQDFVDEFEVGDTRRDYLIAEEGDDYFGTPFNSLMSNTGYGIRKYIIPAELEAKAADSGINYHLIRYADVLLMYAEALNGSLGGPDAAALDAINLVRARAGLTGLASGLSEQEFLDAIIHERRIELIWENVRTFDLIRWGIAEEVLGDFNGFIAPKHETLPIPQSELDANPLLVQNPNYQ